jgi:hypothetical protein
MVMTCWPPMELSVPHFHAMDEYAKLALFLLQPFGDMSELTDESESCT